LVCLGFLHSKPTNMSNLLFSQIPLEQLKIELLEGLRAELNLLNQEKNNKSSFDDLKTRKEAAAFLKICLPTLDAYTKRGQIECHRTPSLSGKRYKITDLQNALVKVKTFKKNSNNNI
jgi:hypothetical protein